MSEHGHGGPQKSFSGDGSSGAAEYKVWKRWARSALEVKKVCGMSPEALGPRMYTLLDGQAACMDGGELDQRGGRRSGGRGHGKRPLD